MSKFLPKLEVNLNNIVHNYKIMHDITNCEITAAVLKANAYGVGAQKVGSALFEYGGCKNFFVATIEEAIELRNRFNEESLNIYCFSGIFAGDEEEFINYNIKPVIIDFYQLEIYKKLAQKYNKKLSAIIHFDTGINRTGFNIEDAPKIIGQDLNWLNVEYIMSHFASADNRDSEFNQFQLAQFESVFNYFPNVKKSLLNSSACFLADRFHFDMARIGKSLYGPSNMLGITHPELKIAVKLTAPIIQIREIHQDGKIGYGCTFKVKKGQRIATLALGYADGFLRSYGNKAKLYYKGCFVPLIGRVSMDYITIDITKVPVEQINIGDEIEVLGENITYDMHFIYSSTTTYEIFTRLSGRVKRV